MILGHPLVHLVSQPFGERKGDARLWHNKLSVWKAHDTPALGKLEIRAHGRFTCRKGNPRVAHIAENIGERGKAAEHSLFAI